MLSWCFYWAGCAMHWIECAVSWCLQIEEPVDDQDLDRERLCVKISFALYDAYNWLMMTSVDLQGTRAAGWFSGPWGDPRQITEEDMK